MRWRTLSLFLLTATMCFTAPDAEGRDGAMATAVGPGVPRELARHRAAHYRDVSYALAIKLAPGEELLRGRLRVGVTLDREAGDLVLDWRVLQKGVAPAERVSDLTVNGKKIDDAQFINEHIVIPRAHLRAGANAVEMMFASPVSTAGSAVTRYLDREDGSEYVYTLFVPSDASTAFPCFDQPDLKARFKLTVVAPAEWEVITNTPADRVVIPVRMNPPDGYIEEDGLRVTVGMRRIVFGETEPISTYVFAFAAGPFAEIKDERSRHATRMYVRKSKAGRARQEAAEVFRLNREALKYFEGYFAHKFPFSKYDLVVIPEFAYNGMEHAGATFLREERILFPTDPTANELVYRGYLMFHEAAHQWFGDLVTMRWFDDLWLKEGFATFMGYKAVEAVMPQYDAWKVFYLTEKPLAYLTDVTKGTTPIWQEIPNLSAAKSAYGNIVYRKAPAMLRQAEFFLGAPQFQKAVRLLTKEHAYANAEWSDLVRAFERASNRRAGALGAWADAWVRRRGMPDVRVSWDVSRAGRINQLKVEQRDVLGEGGAWPMRVRLLLAARPGARPDTLTVMLKGAGVTRVREAVGRKAPAFVFANDEDYGYGRFLLDARSREAVTRNLGAIEDDFLRALLWGSLWDSVREAELAPADFVELVVSHAPRERDEVALQFVLARAQTAFTRYLSDAQRARLAPRLEGMIYERMLRAETAGLRITYFRAYREVATTGEALKNLSDILTEKLKVPGMTLRSRDRFDIIRALLAAGDERAPDLLKEQSRDDRTDDGRRYAFAAVAAQPVREVKDQYFERYLRDASLAESWIEASFVPFNTPRQAELTLPFLEPALRELPALKRTRKIFFVNGWLAAFVGGQCSEEAARTVRDFLAREGLDRDLRLKVLEAADGLERCVRIRAKYAAGGADSPRPAS